MHFKVPLHTLQQFALHRSGCYFKDWCSQNSLAISCTDNSILSSLHQLLISLHKCTCCSQLPQKSLLGSFQFLSSVYLATFQLDGSLACIAIFMGLWGMYSYFYPRMLSGQLMCLKQATSYIPVSWFPEAKEWDTNRIQICSGCRIKTIFTYRLMYF